MLIVLSPAKTLDYETPLPEMQKNSQPVFLDRAKTLISTLRKLSLANIEDLMEISPKLATLNAERYKAFSTPFTKINARPCLYAFKGDVYEGLDAYSLKPQAARYANDHVRILSGLYGVLRPFDLMQPYRLEMGTSLKVGNYKNLYEFWGKDIAQNLNETLAAEKHPVLVNLASEEYFKAIDKTALSARIITPVFKEKKGKELKIVSFFAKKARGLMARHIVQKRIEKPENIKSFQGDGYSYAEDLSTKDQLVFVR